MPLSKGLAVMLAAANAVFRNRRRLILLDPQSGEFDKCFENAVQRLCITTA